MINLLIVTTGIMAGIYFAFSVFIMKSLSLLPAQQAVQAMNSINTVITNTLFLPLFFGTTLLHIGQLVWSFLDYQQGRSILLILAAAVYIIGMFAVTVFGNVPLNNQLKESEANPSTLTYAWQSYLNHWTRLNHWRTISCTASCALLTAAVI